MGPYEDGEGVRGVMIEDLLESNDVQGLGQEFLDREFLLLYICVPCCSGLINGCMKRARQSTTQVFEEGDGLPNMW